MTIDIWLYLPLMYDGWRVIFDYIHDKCMTDDDWYLIIFTTNLRQMTSDIWLYLPLMYDGWEWYLIIFTTNVWRMTNCSGKVNEETRR